MNKEAELATIAQEIDLCKTCRQEKIGKAVPGEGNPNATIVFVGEAPGKTEAATGRPFIGRSGKFLRQSITAIGFTEDDVFITSPVKYLPKRGTPTVKDIAHGKTHLAKQLGVIDPRIIVLLGSVATQGVLGEKIPVMKEHGSMLERDGKKYFITLHPAAAIRFAPLRTLFLEDFEKLKHMIAD